MKKLLTLMAIFALVLSLSSCAETDEVEDGMMEDAATESEMMENASAMMEYDVNMFFQSDFAEDYAGYDMMVNGVIDGWTYPEGAAGAAGVTPGMKMVVVNMTVMNPDSDMNAGPGMNDFSLMVNGEAVKPVWFLAGSGREQFPNMMSVAPDGETSADLLFEVPVGTDLSTVEFSFVNSLSTDGGTQFGLGDYIK